MYVGQMRCTLLPRLGANLWWVPLQWVDNQATAPTSPSPSQRYSRLVPLLPQGGRLPPCGPSWYIICGHVQVPRVSSGHGLGLRVPVLYIFGLMATRGHGVFSCAHIQYCSSDRGSLTWARSFCVLNDADKGALKAEGLARLEPPENPSCASLEFCTCAAGCEMHIVRGDGQPTGGGKIRRDGASSCLSACALLCYLVPWLLRCTHRMRPCFLLVAVALHCPALPLYPGRYNGSSPVAVANANALQSPLPRKPWLAGILGPLGPPSCCGPPQAALGPIGASKAGTTCRREMPGNSSRRHDKC